MSVEQRALLLHFDINGTVLVADPAGALTAEEALNVYLTGVLWRSRETSKLEFSLAPPSPEAVCYYKELENKMVVPGGDRRPFKNIVKRFTSTPEGAPWQYLLRKMLSGFGDTSPNDYLLIPSFLRLLDMLRTLPSGLPVAVVFRTYGDDAQRLLNLVSEYEVKTHCHTMRKIVAQKKPWQLLRGPDCSMFKICEEGSNVPVAVGEDSVSSWFASLCTTGDITLVAVRDDYDIWAHNNFHTSWSKPIWPNEKLCQIFFDDNIREGDNSIVDVRGVQDTSVLCKAQMLESTTEPQYFCRAVMKMFPKLCNKLETV